MKNSRITEAFRKLNLKTFEVDGRPECVRMARDCAVEYCKNFNDIKDSRYNSFALLGKPGSGKTHLICGIANYFLKRGISVLYFQHVEGFGDLKSDMDKLQEKLEVLKNIDLLVWDDAWKSQLDERTGRPKATNFEIKTMFDVINYRYMNHKPFIISSELDRDGLVEIDEALGSRIIERSKTYSVLMELNDMERARKIELNYRLA
jgi:DNA replication protein DnaC